jgi:glycyl-tRNA synthetase beta chain
MTFLLEIGTEEIPDWMIPSALDYLRAQFPNAQADGTSRRLTVRVPHMPEREADREELITGPAKGSPEAAIQGFARKQGVKAEDLQLQNNKYTHLKLIPGRATRDILAETLPGIILKTPFPKTMYWTTKSGPRFIRPIRWIVALLADQIIPFEVAGIQAGNHSSGHRRLGSASFPVTYTDYEPLLRENGVILSAADRQAKIESEISARIKPDPALMHTLVYLTEFPTAITGNFDSEFLTLPAEVLITVMRYHQKYFSVEHENGSLAPHFVAVMNTAADPDGLVQHGNERVLRARFNDARFFWDSDQKRTLEARVEDLKHVTFQAKLGTYFDKTQRVEGLVAILNGDAHALRAARLCKVDLTTELVKEFTELQGIIGGLYARAQGEPESVSTAIYDHYKPASMEDTIPRTQSGRILSIADKLDTLIGCFQAGLIPSGSKDPFALRRAAQGIVKILVEAKLNIPIRSYLKNDAKLEEFFLDRVRYYFRDLLNFKYDEVNAAIASGWDDLSDVEARLEAIQSVRPTEDFEPLAASFKRIRNILKQANFTPAAEDQVSGLDLNSGLVGQALPPAAFINPTLLEPGPEQNLYSAFQTVRTKIKGLPYPQALTEIASLRPAVDHFFDKVMVNAPDERVRQNRLALLHAILIEFSTIADFSEIVTNSQENQK